MSDLHTHTVYSDGRDTPEEMVLSAIEKGLEEIGISDHSYTDFDTSWCMKREDIPRYKAEINGLKAKYAGKISVKCGVEQDYRSAESTEGFDYVIGSVHYVRVKKTASAPTGESTGMSGDSGTAVHIPTVENPEISEMEVYIPVDESAEILEAAAEKYFSGDIYALCEVYFENLSDVVDRTGCDIIGHFDLISKFTEKSSLIDTENPRYVAAWKKAADRLLEKNVPFEINYGAISRGYRTGPYPAEPIYLYLKDRGAEFVYSSDAHQKENVGFRFF